MSCACERTGESFDEATREWELQKKRKNQPREKQVHDERDEDFRGRYL